MNNLSNLLMSSRSLTRYLRHLSKGHIPQTKANESKNTIGNNAVKFKGFITIPDNA